LIKWAESQPGVADSSALLLSVSQGAWVATRVATSDARVGAMIQISGAATSPLDADTYASQVAWRRRGLEAGAIDTLTRLWQREAEAVMHSGSAAHWSRYRELVEQARQAPWWDRAGYGALQPTDWFADWYRRVATYDPRADIASLRIPVLWLLGANDSQLDGPASARLLRDIQERSNARLEVRLFPDADHGIFAPVDSLARPLGVTRSAEGFFDAVDRFLEQFRAGRAAQR
jgi:pimeloyl-ACP methyl ester carboxylesterase